MEKGPAQDFLFIRKFIEFSAFMSAWFSENLLKKLSSGWSRGKSTFSSFAKCGWHGISNFFHGNNNFICRNGTFNSGKGQFSTYESTGNAGGISFDAGISTSPATGSHTSPRIFLRVIATAESIISGVPPASSTTAAAAIAAAEPHSA